MKEGHTVRASKLLFHMRAIPQMMKTSRQVSASFASNSWYGYPWLYSAGIAEVQEKADLSLRDLVFLILYLGFYLLGYSPEKWYERKKIPENTNA